MEKEIQRLMDTYGNDVLRTSYMYLKDLQSAEDAFQEVFIKVFNKFGNFKGQSSEKTWIIRITINVCKDMLRSSWLKKILLTDNVKEKRVSIGIENRIIKIEENRLLFDEVMSLSHRFKEVIILYYYQNCNTVEISKILSVAEGTVRSRLHRAREILKTRLGGRLDISD
ncbi:MAG: sigma-70 family RNA polymerase sigma factor [Clostridium sartagoforme]|nr:sigma-70 family RNA polymerase sigma factor [Clostridium sartagoforme]